MSEYRGRKPRRDSGFSEVAVVEAVFAGLWTGIKALFSLFRGGKKQNSADTVALQRAVKDGWEYVELHLLQNADVLAVSEADKVFDAALRLKRFRGESLGERLKNAEKAFPYDLYQQIWSAHKLRNRLAHEVGANVSRPEAQLAVSTFRTALTYLGVL